MSALVPLTLTVLLLLSVLVLVGRAAVPRVERVRLRCWRLEDLRAAAAIGGRQIGDAVGHAHRRDTGAWT